MPTDLLDDVRRAVVAGDPDVLAAYVFGSVARGEARDDSDVDVAVLRGAPPPSTFAEWGSELRRGLERQLGREVDLVWLDDAPPDLTHRVLRDGILVFERDRSARIAFEVRARNAYWDLLPFLRRYRREAS